MEIEEKYYNLLAGLISGKEVEIQILLGTKEEFYYVLDDGLGNPKRVDKPHIKEERINSKSTIDLLDADSFDFGLTDIQYDKVVFAWLVDGVKYKFIPSEVVDLFTHMIKKEKVKIDFEGDVRGSFVGYIDTMFYDVCGVVDSLDKETFSFYIDYKRVYSVEKV
jgi:hypothetical protein